MLKNKYFVFGIIVLTLGIVGNMDYEDAKLDNKKYCDMTKIWHDEERYGVDELYRKGWYPYDNTIICNYEDKK